MGEVQNRKKKTNVEHVTKSRRWQKRKAFHICSICFTSSFEICLHIHITCIYVHYVSPYLCFHCYSERGDFPLICSGARTQVATFEVATHWSFTSCSPEDWGLSCVICISFLRLGQMLFFHYGHRGNFDMIVLIFDCFKQIGKRYDTSRSEDIEKWAIVHWLKVRGSQTDCCSELVRHRKELASELVFCWFSFFSLFLLDTDMICQELGATVHRLKSIKTSCSNESNWIEEETIFSV